MVASSVKATPTLALTDNRIVPVGHGACEQCADPVRHVVCLVVVVHVGDNDELVPTDASRCVARAHVADEPASGVDMRIASPAA